MGLRDWKQRHKFADPVPGSLEVHSCEHDSRSSSHVDINVIGMLSAPGVNACTVSYQGRAARNKCPRAGAILPVLVDQADPQHFQIEWDQVPTEREIVEQELQDFAEQASTTPLNQGFTSTNVTVTGGDLSSLPPQAREQVQAILGNLGHMFDGMPGANVVVEQPQVTINGQSVAPGQAGGSLFGQFQHLAASMADHVPSAMSQPTTAVVLAAHSAHHIPDFAASQAPGGIVDLTLDVRGVDGNDYSATTRVAFSTQQRRERATAPGTELPVLVDPANPRQVTIDTSRIPGW